MEKKPPNLLEHKQTEDYSCLWKRGVRDVKENRPSKVLFGEKWRLMAGATMPSSTADEK